MLSALTGSARSESARCPGRSGVWPPIVRGNAECYHPLSGSSECLPRVVWVDAKNIFESFSIQKPHKNEMSQLCPGWCRVKTTCCPGRRGVPPPVVRGDAECHHPSSGATRSVAIRCPGQLGVSTPVVRGDAEIWLVSAEWAIKFKIFYKIKGTDYELIHSTTL